MKSIKEAGDIRGKRVLVRMDWNVPIKEGKLLDDYRIKRSLKTIEYLREQGARTVVISHLEPATESLKTVAEHVSNFVSLSFCPETIGNEANRCIENLQSGGVLVLENLRMNNGEESNDQVFAKDLAGLADIYVNEAFSASHRTHASIASVPKYTSSFAGLEFVEEIENLSKALEPEHPMFLILGGAKFETKLSLLKKYVKIADKIFVGGALAHNFFKEQGIDIKKSLVSEGNFGIKELLESGKIMLPEEPLWSGERIVDAGLQDIENCKSQINSSKLILWNGPLGNYELGFKNSSIEIAKAIADSGKNSIIGGGDTVAVIRDLDAYDKFSFVSTAGGAMLDYLANGTLPGIEALG